METNNEQINVNLKKHQQNLDNWEKKDLVQELHRWIERFVLEFKLDIGVPALTVERLRCTRLGHFCSGRDGFGLLNEIALNDIYVSEKLSWNNLATLLHELGHAHQERTGNPGKSGYHNKEYTNWAETVGLNVDESGHTSVAPSPSPFSKLLSRHGIEISAPPESKQGNVKPEKPIQGKSKLKLWVCSCEPKPVRVRVAIPDFQAKCLKCNDLFRRKDR